jgi:hypothetical protein
MHSGVSAPPHELVGRTCVIRTDRLGRDYGLAEVITADGASMFIEVRLYGKAGAAQGWSALIYYYDPAARCYWVVPVDSTG